MTEPFEYLVTPYPLIDDSLELADRLRKDGQVYYLTIWPGVGHSAIVMIPITPETQAQLDAMTMYLRGVLMDNKGNLGQSK